MNTKDRVNIKKFQIKMILIKYFSKSLLEFLYLTKYSGKNETVCTSVFQG